MAVHKCELEFLSRSDGSAFYSIGTTAVLASVHGPGDTKVSNRLHNKLYLDVSFSPQTGTSNIHEKNMENLIADTVKQTLLTHFHPRTAIMLSLQEMQSGGLLLSTSINAACLALLDAGTQMKTTFAAVTCSVSKDQICIVEPSELEIEESVAVFTFVFEGSNLEVLSVHQKGSLDINNYDSCVTSCRTTAKDIFAFYRRTLENKYKCFYDKL